MGVILADLSKEQLIAQIEAMRQVSQSKLTCKVSDKGALSIYGLGRFPVTLYMTQYDKLAANWDMIATFVKTNRSMFATKD